MVAVCEILLKTNLCTRRISGNTNKFESFEFGTKSATILIFDNYCVGQIFQKLLEGSNDIWKVPINLHNFGCVFLELWIFKENCLISVHKFDHYLNYCTAQAWRKTEHFTVDYSWRLIVFVKLDKLFEVYFVNGEFLNERASFW